MSETLSYKDEALQNFIASVQRTTDPGDYAWEEAYEAGNSPDQISSALSALDPETLQIYYRSKPKEGDNGSFGPGAGIYGLDG